MRLQAIAASVIVTLVLSGTVGREARAQEPVDPGSVARLVPSNPDSWGASDPGGTTREILEPGHSRRRSLLSRFLHPSRAPRSRDVEVRRTATGSGTILEPPLPPLPGDEAPIPGVEVQDGSSGPARVASPSTDPLPRSNSPTAVPGTRPPAAGVQGNPAATGAPVVTGPPALPSTTPSAAAPVSTGILAPGEGGGMSAIAGEAPVSSAVGPVSETLSSPEAFGAGGQETGAGFGGTVGTGNAPFAMIGDIAPFATRPVSATTPIPGPPVPPGARGASPIYPSVRNFNISENQSPRPQDRIFFDFNYYSNIGDALNRADLSPITRMKAYVYNFGLEKTFNNGMGSIGIRIPLDNLTADSYGNIVNTPTSTAPGNLTIFAKYILAINEKTGSLVSAAWAISPPTGPSRFAGASYMYPLQATYFQPSIAYIYNRDRFYVQGFSGFGFSMNPNDVSWIYNDIGIGYYLIRREDPLAWIRALAPVLEVHVNNPINHRDWQNRFDLAGSPDNVSLTYGLNIGLRNAAVLTAALVTPVTTPKPFDSEAVLMLNIYYGRTRRTTPFTPPPAVGL